MADTQVKGTSALHDLTRNALEGYEMNFGVFWGKPKFFILDKIKVDTICNTGTYADYISVIDHVYTIFYKKRMVICIHHFHLQNGIQHLLCLHTPSRLANLSMVFVSGVVLDPQLHLLCLWRLLLMTQKKLLLFTMYISTALITM